MEQTVLCDHSEVTVYTNKEGETLFEFCSQCGLPPRVGPIITYPGEMEPWWEWKPVSKRLIDANRPGINRWHEYRSHLKEQIALVTDLLAWEDEIGEPSDLGLVAELYDLIEEQKRTGVPWPQTV